MVPTTRLERLPRMADFALWATACETAIWPAGTFWAAYCGNRDEAIAGVIESDPVAAALRSFMAARTMWTGIASELLGALGEAAGEAQRKSKGWPDSPRALSGRLRRAATFLRKIGIEIGVEREGRARTRTIHITAAPENGEARSSASSAQSARDLNARTIAGSADGTADGRVNGNGSTVRIDCPKASGSADGADATIPSESAAAKSSAATWSARL